MMRTPWLLTPCLLVACGGGPERPLTTEQALFRIPETRGRIFATTDHDGDGTRDLLLYRRRWGRGGHFDVVSGRDGSTLKTLLSVDEPQDAWDGFASRGTLHWDAGGDVDGDGVGDLLIGRAGSGEAHEGNGLVQLRSGRDGALLHESRGTRACDGFGCAVAFLGDLDGDGAAEYAVGAPQVERGLQPSDEPTRAQRIASWQRRMRLRSERPGYVSLRSGATGRELWRVTGSLPGEGFGALVRAFGDLDGDGLCDLLVQCDPRSGEPVRILSGVDGAPLAAFATDFGPTGAAGDFDGDGVPDVFVDAQDFFSTSRSGGTRVLSGRDGRVLEQLAYPDPWGDYGLTAAMGDLDGDGFDELAVAEPNFNLEGKPLHWSVWPSSRIDRISLTRAVELRSEARLMTPESGCALIYSGRTREVLVGIWGRPGSREGLGFQICPLPDLSGDGFPDIAISGAGEAFVFAGPGRR